MQPRPSGSGSRPSQELEGVVLTRTGKVFARFARVARFPCGSKGLMSAAHESAARLASTHPLFQLSIIVVTPVCSLALRARGRDPCKPSEILTSPCKNTQRVVTGATPSPKGEAASNIQSFQSVKVENGKSLGPLKKLRISENDGCILPNQ